MSALRFFNAIPATFHEVDSALVIFFVYYLIEEQGKPFATVADVRQCFVDCDITPPKRIAQYLSEGVSKRPAQFVKAPEMGYRLERSRKEGIARSLGERTAIVQTSAQLRALESQFPDGPTKAYLSEAIDCFETGANRAAVIMVWMLTMDHLLNYAFANKLADFNAALATNPDRKVKVVKTREDFQDINEDKIIELCRAARVITGDVQKILKDHLGTRNTAAHPSGVKIAQSKAITVIEDLVENVIKKF